MNKQEVSNSPSRGKREGKTMVEDRYYVQRLTEQVFVIRERQSVKEGLGSNDRIVKSFDISHDAYVYLESMNEKQRTLDAEKREV